MWVRGTPETDLEERITDQLQVMVAKLQNGTIDLSQEARKLISLFVEHISGAVDREVAGKLEVGDRVDPDTPTALMTDTPKGIYLPFTLAKEVKDRDLRIVLSILNVAGISVIAEKGKGEQK